MSPEDEKYYENYFDLFLTNGWKQFIEETKEALDLDRIEDIKDEKHLYTLQGERASLNRIANFESSIRLAYDSILEANSAEEI